VRKDRMRMRMRMRMREKGYVVVSFLTQTLLLPKVKNDKIKQSIYTQDAKKDNTNIIHTSSFPIQVRIITQKWKFVWNENVFIIEYVVCETLLSVVAMM
jgi:hypothetical protein